MFLCFSVYVLPRNAYIRIGGSRKQENSRLHANAVTGSELKEWLTLFC